MTAALQKGTISFVNYEKQFATIEYQENGKKKSVNFNTKLANTTPAKPGAATAKAHYFRVGDEVQFTVGLTDRGDKMTAREVKFLYNTALEVVLNKAVTQNEFTGYLKEADNQLFVKEINSYLFFPIELSPWEQWPDPALFNEQVHFRLLHADNIKKMAAELLTSEWIPEYKKLRYHFNKKEAFEATITKVSPYAIYLDLAGGKINGKIPLDKSSTLDVASLKPGDTMKVKIEYLGKTKIVVALF